MVVEVAGWRHFGRTAGKRPRDVFQKANTNRQAELVRHVLAKPLWSSEQAKRPGPAVLFQGRSPERLSATLADARRVAWRAPG